MKSENFGKIFWEAFGYITQNFWKLFNARWSTFAGPNKAFVSCLHYITRSLTRLIHWCGEGLKWQLLKIKYIWFQAWVVMDFHFLNDVRDKLTTPHSDGSDSTNAKITLVCHALRERGFRIWESEWMLVLGYMRAFRTYVTNYSNFFNIFHMHFVQNFRIIDFSILHIIYFIWTPLFPKPYTLTSSGKKSRAA